MRNIFVIVIIIAIIIIIAICIQKPYKPTPLILNLKRKLALVNPEFGNYDIRESDSSYTEDKATIFICTKDPKTKQYYSDNTLIYVCLHECAHVMSKDYGHHDEFKKIFHSLVNRAISYGIYNPSIPIPRTYCGMN